MAQTVYVGLSGGVDSAVSAALLKERGFKVIGAFIKIWRPEFIECTWRQDRLDALRIAAALKIPFREVDLSEAYKKSVVDEMLAAYQRGLTPNPDVLCNRTVKFGAFLEWAKGEGADFIATGHYARIKQNAGHLELLRGTDAAKDQSYFLYRLTQQDLAKTLFPVGGMRKSEVRSRARSFDLPVADKPDSQGLCFVGDVSMPDFLRRFLPLERGAIVNRQGAVIGEHEGAACYTVGERHGLTIFGSREPHYVIAVDTEHNTVVASPQRQDAAPERASLAEVSWVYRPPRSGARVEVQTRYREAPMKALIENTQSGATIHFEKPAIASPGQSLVVYEGEVCLGGGVIEKRVAPPRAVHSDIRLRPRRIQ